MKQLSAMVDRKLHDGFAVETETAGAAATKEDLRDESQLHRWTISVTSARHSTGLFMLELAVVFGVFDDLKVLALLPVQIRAQQ